MSLELEIFLAITEKWSQDVITYNADFTSFFEKDKYFNHICMNIMW